MQKIGKHLIVIVIKFVSGVIVCSWASRTVGVFGSDNLHHSSHDAQLCWHPRKRVWRWRVRLDQCLQQQYFFFICANAVSGLQHLIDYHQQWAGHQDHRNLYVCDKKSNVQLDFFHHINSPLQNTGGNIVALRWSLGHDGGLLVWRVLGPHTMLRKTHRQHN